MSAIPSERTEGCFPSCNVFPFPRREGGNGSFEKVKAAVHDVLNCSKQTAESLKHKITEIKAEDFFNPLKKHSKKLLKAATTIKSLWLVITGMPKQAKEAFKAIKILKVFDVPAFFSKIWKVKEEGNKWDAIELASEGYFLLHDIRAGADVYLRYNLIPAWELPLTAVMGMGSVITMAKAHHDYKKVLENSARFPTMTVEEGEKHIKALIAAENKRWSAGFLVVASAAIGSTVFFPHAAYPILAYNLAKGLGGLHSYFNK